MAESISVRERDAGFERHTNNICTVTRVWRLDDGEERSGGRCFNI